MTNLDQFKLLSTYNQVSFSEISAGGDVRFCIGTECGDCIFTIKDVICTSSGTINNKEYKDLKIMYPEYFI